MEWKKLSQYWWNNTQDIPVSDFSMVDLTFFQQSYLQSGSNIVASHVFKFILK